MTQQAVTTPIQQVTAEIVAIGTEILLGELTDTNSVFIAGLLRNLGINVYYMTSVGDNERRITDALQIALNRADVVITCGGLGPTVDDMTRQAVAAATSRGLSFQQHLLDAIAARFATFRAPMTENNRQQAYVPDNAIIVENPVGTAPSFIVEVGEKAVISVPGVPREMKFLMNEKIAPYLRERYGLGGTIIKAKVIRTAGIGESLLDETIGRDLLEGSNPTIGLNAHMGQVDVRITAKAATEDEADRMIAETERVLRSRIEPYIYGTGKETIEAALVAELARQNARLAVVHAGIQPLFVERLAAFENGADFIARNDHFALVTDLDHESDNLRTVAEEAAETAAEASGAQVGIAIVSRAQVGIAIVSRAQGDVDHADSEALSAIALWSAGGKRSRSYGFGADADTAREWLSLWAMSMAWRMLREQAEQTAASS